MPNLFEEQSCSHLSFIVDKGTTERIRVDQLRRAREPVSRSKSSVQGKVADVVHGRSRHAESPNELKAFQILLATARADAWQEQPFILKYHHEGAKHRYTPDILVIWGTHKQVVEVKDDAEAELPENQPRFALINQRIAGRTWLSLPALEEIRDLRGATAHQCQSRIEVSLRCDSKKYKKVSSGCDEKSPSLCQLPAGSPGGKSEKSASPPDPRLSLPRRAPPTSTALSTGPDFAASARPRDSSARQGQKSTTPLLFPPALPGK